ncbi:MAG: acetate uptake transporter [Actinomycetota bacterium]|nr:acetate uptake transporter [Actinomycetota bacterium]
MADNTPTVADPGPLGLAGFATTTFVLSLVNSGLIPAGDVVVVLPLALVYGGIAQLLAGMWEFKRNNTFGAVTFTSYGAFWLSFYFLAKDFLKGAPSDAVAIFLLAWTIFSLGLLVASFGTNGLIAAIFVVLAFTFGALTFGAFTGSAGFTKIGGYLGILLAIMAWYGFLAGVANNTFGRTVFPTFPFKK